MDIVKTYQKYDNIITQINENIEADNYKNYIDTNDNCYTREKFLNQYHKITNIFFNDNILEINDPLNIGYKLYSHAVYNATINDYESKINFVNTQIKHLKGQMEDLFDLKELLEDEYKGFLKSLIKIEERGFYLKKIYENEKFSIRTIDKHYDPSLSEKITNQFRALEYEELNNKSKVKRYLYDLIRKNHYLRFGESLYKKKFHNGQFTYVYEKEIKISDFVWREISEEKNNEQLINLENSSGSHENLIKDITYSYDVKQLIKSRHIISFNNGVLVKNLRDENDKLYMKFINYDKVEEIQKYRNNQYSMKFIPEDFPEEIINMDFLDIKTPSLNMVYEYQLGHREDFIEIYSVILALLGRLFSPVGENDNWQVVPFIIGHAGTGKGTSAHFVKCLFNRQDVGTIENKMEKIFCLQSLRDKLINLGSEIKDDFSIDQTTFQKMVSGEDVSISIKNKEAESRDWDIPMLLAGNRLPGYCDNSGSLERRLVPIPFRKKVKKCDTSLYKKIEKELPYIYTKINKAYYHYVNNYSGDSFWDFCGKFFNDQRNITAKESNTMFTYLNSNFITPVEGSYIKVNDLRCNYNRYFRSSGFSLGKKINVDINEMSNPLESYARLKDCDDIEFINNIENNWFKVVEYEDGSETKEQIDGNFIKNIEFTHNLNREDDYDIYEEEEKVEEKKIVNVYFTEIKKKSRRKKK